MATLKRQKSDGSWEYVGTISKEVVYKSEKGVANGVATLGADGKVPASQLNISSNASAITLTDSANYYTSTSVEGALAEIGQALVGTTGKLISDINALLG